MKPLVVILMGSPADEEHSKKIVAALARFDVEVVTRVGSAHRTPEHALQLVRMYDAMDRAKVFITIAGRSNALSGFTDPQVLAPVIACPPPGPDSDLWSSVRMPPGVACSLVLEPLNAAIFAAKIFALHNADIAGEIALLQQENRDRVMAGDAQANHG